MKNRLSLLIFSLLLVCGLTPTANAYYDPDTGTFITKDPTGFVDGPNLYTYVQQNPWTWFDPEGLATKKQYEDDKKAKQADMAACQQRQQEINDAGNNRALTYAEKDEFNRLNRRKFLDAGVIVGDMVLVAHIEASAQIVALVNKEKVDQVEGYLDDKSDLFKNALLLAREGRIVELITSYYAGRALGAAAEVLIGKILTEASFEEAALPDAGGPGAARRLIYEPNDKHPPAGSINPGEGDVGPQPTNGQAALDTSLPFNPNSTGRVAVDPKTGEFIVFRQHGDGVFHGYAVTWGQLTQPQKNALIGSGQVSVGGKIK